jgi:hypothetical protein
MGFGFSSVVVIAELESLQALFAAIELRSRAGMTVSDHTLIFRTAGDKPHQSLPSVTQKAKHTTTLNLRHDQTLSPWIVSYWQDRSSALKRSALQPSKRVLYIRFNQ